MVRVTISAETFNTGIAIDVLRTLLNKVEFDSESGCGEVVVTLDTVAKFYPYPTGQIKSSVQWKYTVEQIKP
jgi:hypothetical protein